MSENLFSPNRFKKAAIPLAIVGIAATGCAQKHQGQPGENVASTPYAQDAKHPAILHKGQGEYSNDVKQFYVGDTRVTTYYDIESGSDDYLALTLTEQCLQGGRLSVTEETASRSALLALLPSKICADGKVDKNDPQFTFTAGVPLPASPAK